MNKKNKQILLVFLGIVLVVIVVLQLRQPDVRHFQPEDELTGPYVGGLQLRVGYVKVGIPFLLKAQAKQSESQIAYWYERQNNEWILLGQQTVSNIDMTSSWLFPNGKQLASTYRYYVAFYVAGAIIGVNLPTEQTNELTVTVIP